jgi:hypothetical protein
MPRGGELFCQLFEHKITLSLNARVSN